jgi:hypothetical protein
MLRQPIIFVCHGLGGLLVKKSLVYSSTRTASKIDHLRDQFVSTFAILFFGTPHSRTVKSNWLALEKLLDSAQQPKAHHVDHLQHATEDEDLHFFQSITGEFAPLMKQFHMFFFWEELRTSFGDHSDFIVDPSSAVLDLDNTEKAGIHATHSRMVRFNSIESSNYRMVIEALFRYCHLAPRIVSHRWCQAIPALNQLRVDEAYELGGLGFDVHLERPFRHREVAMQRTTHRHFYPPQDAASDFIGREDMFRILYDAFFPGGSLNVSLKRKSFVVFGMGGSGKTQLCSNFAQDYQDQYGYRHLHCYGKC